MRDVVYRNAKVVMSAICVSLALWLCFFNNIEELIIWVFFFFILFYNKEYQDSEIIGRKDFFIYIICSAGISLAVVLGIKLWEKKQIFDKKVYVIIACIGLSLIVYTVVKKMFSGLTVQICEHKLMFLKVKPIVFILLSMALLMICWLPMLLANYPGIVVSDSEWQWNQALGVYNLSNHHPVLHTMFIRLAQQICILLCGSVDANIAVCIYSVMQMAIMALVISCMMCYLYRQGTFKVLLIIAYLYYAIFPLQAMFSIYMTKDTLFSVFVFLLVALCERIYFSDGEWIKKPVNCVLVLIDIFLVTFLRSNGILVSIAVLLVLGICYRKYFKEFGLILLIIMICWLAKGKVFSVYNVGEANIVESLGMPINQIGNIVVKEKSLTDEETALIENVLSLEDIKEAYSPYYSDPIKFHGNFNSEAISNNKGEYFKLWIRLFFKYPRTCLEASLNLTIGYWYPGVPKGAISYNIPEKNRFLEGIGAKPHGILFHDDMYDYFLGTDVRDNPILSWLFSIGDAVIFMFMLCFFSVSKIGWKATTVFLPNIIVWLTMLVATPSYCETRYVYSIFITLPFYLNFVCYGLKLKFSSNSEGERVN